MGTRPFICQALIRDREVRRLIIHSLDGIRRTELIELTMGLRRSVAFGSEYEMRQQAHDVAQRWIREEAFAFLAPDELVYEPLRNTVALAIEMGHVVLYDERYLNTWNLSGTVALEKWNGLIGKGGKPYEYGYTGTMILARPAFPPEDEIQSRLKSGEDTAFVLKEIVVLRSAVGDSRKFVLGGSD